MSAPTFAIVITAYEAAGTIAAAVESALAQTRPAEELIVVDDGSSDDLAGALQPYMDRIELVRRENGGGAAARNTGAQAAKSDFMAVLDADDAYHPRRLEAIAAQAEERPELDLVTTDARLLAQGEAVGTFATFTPFVWEEQRTAIFWTCFVGGWPAIRLSRLESIGGFDERMRIAYDWDCWLRCILDGAAAGFVDEPYYDYVLHQGSLSASRAPSLWERARLLEKAAENPSLRAEERPELERALRMHRSRAVDAETQAAVYGAGERVGLARLALAPRLEPRVRLGAALGFLAPPLARRLVHEEKPAEERLPATT
ncbi:MAG TPA: glycosyltransferase family A protein [Solirubrobacterales bacterium]|nr:glycosyltransferase family A protein [Solirubrobacterales bacterium]